MSADHNKEKKPRQWLDVVAIVISLGAFSFTLYAFYFTELRISDDLTATIIGLQGATDSNGFYTVETGIVFRNEGNRQVVIPSVALELSETPSFDLTVRHQWGQSSPVVIPPKQAVYETVVFGAGRRKYQMIESRKPDMPTNEAVQVDINPESEVGAEEPIIFSRLAMDTMDSYGKLHEVELRTGTMQRGPGLRVNVTIALPYNKCLLPSRDPPPSGTEDWFDPNGISWRWRPAGGRSDWKLDYSGPLGARLPGVYTNTQDRGWPMQLPGEAISFGIIGDFVTGGTGAVHQVRMNQIIGNLHRGEVGRLVSKDGLHVASIIGIHSNKEYCVNLDGKDGSHFDGIANDTLLFSVNSDHLAYVAKKGRDVLVVLDGKIGPGFDGIGLGTPVFSRNGEHCAYVGVKTNKSVIVFDGKMGSQFDWISSVIFSSNDEHFVYVGGKAGKSCVVFDGKPGPQFDGIGANSLIFSSNGVHFVYVGVKAGKLCAVLDGKVGPECDSIGGNSMIFSLTYS